MIKWFEQEYLPIEILEKIIMHLDMTSLKAARQVCGYWKEVVEKWIGNSNYIFFEGKIKIEKERQPNPEIERICRNTLLNLAPFVFKVESYGIREENVMYYDLRIFDTDEGNMLFSTQCWDRPQLTDGRRSTGAVREDWRGGFYDLKVDIRKGSTTLFYRKGQWSLVILNLDTLIETYLKRGKEPITGTGEWYANSIQYTNNTKKKKLKARQYKEFDFFSDRQYMVGDDWHRRNSREICLKGLGITNYSYLIETSSITLVESTDNLTKLCFSI